VTNLYWLSIRKSKSRISVSLSFVVFLRTGHLASLFTDVDLNKNTQVSHLDQVVVHLASLFTDGDSNKNTQVCYLDQVIVPSCDPHRV
jgi:hypothetical protein